MYSLSIGGPRLIVPVVMTALTILTPASAYSATWYWNTTTTGLWINSANWSNNASSGGTTGTVPANDTTTDVAYFNQSSVNGAQTVQLNGDQSVAGIVVSNTGATTIASNNATTRLLTLGSGGMMMLSTANNLTMGGASNPLNLALAVSQTFANNASSRTLTVVGGISRTAGDTTSRTLTINGAGSTALQGTVSDGGASGRLGLTKTGAGQLTLSAANTYTDMTSVDAGTLRLDFTATGAPASNIINNASNSSGLALGSGTLAVVGKASTSNSQRFNGLALNRGASAITATIGTSGTVDLSLGAITRSATSTLNFTLPTTGTVSTTTANANFAGGQQSILGGYATVSGTTWAVSAGDGTAPGAITALTTYNSGFAASKDVDVAIGTSSVNNLTVNSIRFSGTAAGSSGVLSTVNMTGTITVATGGILVGDVGGSLNSHLITGGALTSGNGTDLIVIQNSIRSSSTLDIRSTITGAIGLTKAGVSELRLSGSSDYAGPTNVLAGQLTLGNNLKNPAVDSFISTSSTIWLAPGTIFATDRNQGTFTQGTHFGLITGEGGFGMNRAGFTTVFTLANTYTGATNLSVASILQIGNGGTAGSLSPSSAITGVANAVLAFNRSNTITQGTDFNSVIGGAINVTQMGSGTLALSGANTYSGVTSINAGVLEVVSLANGGAISSTGSSSNAAANLVINGGTLRYVGTGGSSDRSFTTGTNGATIDASGSGALTLSGSSAFTVSNTTAAVTFTGTSTSNNTFSGILGNNGTGTTSLTKAGAGTWIFSNANTYTGTTRINAGTLQIGNASTTGGLAATSAITGSAGATLAFSRTNLVSQGSDFGNAISGGLALSQLGSGTLSLSGTNTFTGATTIGAGVIAIDSANALQSTSGVAIAGGAGLRYTGAAGAFDRNISVTSGMGSVTNAGSGTLTLSGQLAKNGTILRLAGTSPINVTGQITGANDNSDLFVDGVSVTLSNTNNNYNGPTYVYGGGSITLGASNVIPDGSALTLGGTGSDTGTGAINTGTFTDTIASLTTSNLGSTLSIIGSGATMGGLTTTGNVTFGAGTDTLALTISSSLTLGKYQLLTYQGTRSGTFDSVNGLTDSRYNLVYGSGSNSSIDLQMRATQAATLPYAQPTSGTVSAFVNNNVAFSGTLANTTPSGGAALAVSLTGNGGQLTVGSLAASTGTSVPAGSAATITGQIATGTTLGSRSWSVVNTDTSALTSTTATASGVVNVFAHGTPTLSGTTINLGNVLVGSTASQLLTVSNGVAGSPAANTGGITWTASSTPSGFGTGGSNQTGVVASGSGVNYTYALATGSAGNFTGSQTFTFADDTSILGGGSLSGLTVSLTGSVYDPATASLASGGTMAGNAWTINLGEFNQGAGTSTPWNFSISNLLASGSFTADLMLSSFALTGNSGAIFMDLTGTSSFTTLPAGESNPFTAWMSLANTGTFTNTYQLNFTSAKNNQSLGGSQNVTLTVTGIIVVPEPGAVALAGIGVGFAGWSLWKRRRAGRNCFVQKSGDRTR